MKIKLIALCALSLSSLVCAETFTADLEKFGDRGFEVIKVLNGETNIKKLYTSGCNARYGQAQVSINNKTDQGNLRMSGKNCVILKVERMELEEMKPPVEDEIIPKSTTIINAPIIKFNFKNNIPSEDYKIQ